MLSSVWWWYDMMLYKDVQNLDNSEQRRFTRGNILSHSSEICAFIQEVCNPHITQRNPHHLSACSCLIKRLIFMLQVWTIALVMNANHNG